MNVENLTALVIAVGSVVTGTATLTKYLGDKKSTSLNEWKELADRHKERYEEKLEKYKELEKRMEKKEEAYHKKYDEWRTECEILTERNKLLSKRVNDLEYILGIENIDIDDL